MVFRDLTGQRECQVSQPAGTQVADVLAEAVSRLRLPQSYNGVPAEYAVRTQDGHLLRPSDSLDDPRVRDSLTQGENTVMPRLPAA